TDFPDSVGSAAYQPTTGDYFVFARAEGGNEVFRIYRQDIATKAVTPLTPAGVSDLDASRVGVNGGSYGGYMTLACAVHFADRITGAVSVVGISNFVTFLERTESYRRDLRRAEYGDERDPAMRAFLESISPLNHVARITKPL